MNICTGRDGVFVAPYRSSNPVYLVSNAITLPLAPLSLSLSYLGALSVLAVEQALERDAVPLVAAVHRRLAPGVGAVVGGRDVLAEAVVAQEEVVQPRAHLVVLAVAVLTDGHAAGDVGRAKKSFVCQNKLRLISKWQAPIIHRTAQV